MGKKGQSVKELRGRSKGWNLVNGLKGTHVERVYEVLENDGTSGFIGLEEGVPKRNLSGSLRSRD